MLFRDKNLDFFFSRTPCVLPWGTQGWSMTAGSGHSVGFAQGHPQRTAALPGPKRPGDVAPLPARQDARFSAEPSLYDLGLLPSGTSGSASPLLTLFLLIFWRSCTVSLARLHSVPRVPSAQRCLLKSHTLAA